MSALLKIQQSGFTIELTGVDSFKVMSSLQLTQQQREFLKTHKAEIINELTEHSGIAELAAVSKPIIVQCYTPNGALMLVEASDSTHAEWLSKVNPKPCKHVVDDLDAESVRKEDQWSRNCE